MPDQLVPSTIADSQRKPGPQLPDLDEYAVSDKETAISELREGISPSEVLEDLFDCEIERSRFATYDETLSYTLRIVKQACIEHGIDVSEDEWILPIPFEPLYRADRTPIFEHPGLGMASKDQPQILNPEDFPTIEAEEDYFRNFKSNFPEGGLTIEGTLPQLPSQLTGAKKEPEDQVRRELLALQEKGITADPFCLPGREHAGLLMDAIYGQPQGRNYLAQISEPIGPRSPEVDVKIKDLGNLNITHVDHGSPIYEFTPNKHRLGEVTSHITRAIELADHATQRSPYSDRLEKQFSLKAPTRQPTKYRDRDHDLER